MLTCHSLLKLNRATDDVMISFLVNNVICEQGKFTTSIYQKPTFSGVYTNFDSFLPNNYKIGMIYTLLNRYFQI